MNLSRIGENKTCDRVVAGIGWFHYSCGVRVVGMVGIGRFSRHGSEKKEVLK